MNLREPRIRQASIELEAHRTLRMSRSQRFFVPDKRILQLEHASLIFAAGLAGVALASVAGMLLDGFDGLLTVLLPLIFLGLLLFAMAEFTAQSDRPR